jgi:hypothetical protein
MEKTSSYSITKGIADNKELEGYRLCFEKNGTERNIENLQWLHQQNLAQKNTIYYAMEQEEVAAIYTAMPVVFKVEDELVNALQSIDTITDIAHRGKGLFPKLATRLYNDAQHEGYELVYGFPNENSAPGFFKKLQWISFGEAPFLMKPLNLQYFLNKLLGKKQSEGEDKGHVYAVAPVTTIDHNTVIKSLTGFENDYDQLWTKVSKSIKVGANRGAAYMNWRYVQKPGEAYSIAGLYINGNLEGVIVFTIKDKHGGRVGYIMELIYTVDEHNHGKRLLKFARSIFKREKTDVVLAWCFAHSFNYKSYKKSGYFDLPVKFRPQHLFLGVRVFNETRQHITKDIKNWYISYSDSDTV